MYGCAVYCVSNKCSIRSFLFTVTDSRADSQAVCESSYVNILLIPPLLPPDQLDGSMAGDVGFDPLCLSNIDNVGIDLYWLREAELEGFLEVELFGPAPD